MGEDLYLASLT